MIIRNYLCNDLRNFLNKVGGMRSHESKEQTPLLTLLYCDRTVSMVHCFMCLKVQSLDCMTESGFRVRVFLSVSSVLNRAPTCVKKPRANTFDESIKFIHWLFLVILDGFMSLYIVLYRFSSFLTLVSTARNFADFTVKHLCWSLFNFLDFQNTTLYFHSQS